MEIETVRAFAPLPLVEAANARLDAVAREFEAVFIAQMLAPLFSPVSTPEIAGGGKSDDVWNSLLQESYAKAMAERGGFGLADHVKDSLIRLQSAAGLEERAP